MSLSALALAASLPLVGAFHHFCCEMGYRRARPRAAAASAARVFLMLALLVAAYHGAGRLFAA